MTTFTITCPPTVAAKTEKTEYISIRSYTGTEAINAGATEGSSGVETVTEERVRVTNSLSNTIDAGTIVRQFNGIGPACNDDPFGDPYVNFETLDSISFQETFSWNGARTRSQGRTIAPQCPENGGALDEADVIIWTAEATTSSQTTTTQTDTVYQTSFSGTTNSTARTGTLVQTGTMTALGPRTTVTQTQGFTTRTAALSTTRVTTTTQQDTFNRWRTSEGGGTHRGTFQSATVVVLETSNLGNLRPEIAWVVTNRPDFTLTSPAVIEQQAVTQFTVFPSFSTTQGHVEQGTYLNADVGFTFSTSVGEIETPTTYTTTAATGATISVASLFTSIPSPLNQQIGTTLTTQSWGSTIREPRYTGGDISTTTSFSATTHQNRIGTVTWNATHRQSTTVRTSFAFLTAGSSSTSTSDIDDGGDSFSVSQSETKTVTFERPITIAASIDAPFISQNQCGSSLSFAVAAASNVSEAAQSLAAGGVSVRSPRLVAAARTARAPLGSWTYVTASVSVTASAGPSGLSATSASGPSSSIVTESAEGAWQLGGTAISRANLSGGQRINLGGTPPTGAATAFYDAGVFSTTGAAGSGTIEVTEARTDSIDTSAQRTAYVPATGVFISAGAQRYSTTRRNLTALIEETAIITNRDQLVL